MPLLDRHADSRFHVKMHEPVLRLAALTLVAASIVNGCGAAPRPCGAGASAAPVATPLFEAMPFTEWRVVGGAADFEMRPPVGDGPGPTLIGRGPIDRNGFLASPRPLHDFRLSVDVRLASERAPRGEGMNSGIQIRSAERGGTIAGLQIEIDPTERRWSGGVYDERGRGWLASLAEDPAAMAAFRPGEWNRYEIECMGPRVRTRVNGVACAEWFDGVVAGLLAFQVHAGPSCEIALRAPVLEELGSHAWRGDGATVEGDAVPPIAWACRLPEDARGIRLGLAPRGRVELRADDGKVLASVDVVAAEAEPPSGASPPSPDFPKPARRVEVVWLEGKGAALVDGARVATLALARQPAQVAVVGEHVSVRAHAVLAPEPRDVARGNHVDGR